MRFLFYMTILNNIVLAMVNFLASLYKNGWVEPFLDNEINVILNPLPLQGLVLLLLLLLLWCVCARTYTLKCFDCLILI